jgi:uncharacterized protein
MRRREWILGGAWAALLPRRAAAGDRPTWLAAAWRRGDRHQAGVLRLEGEHVAVAASIDLPSRPHAVRVDAAGRLLVVARRPGDWLLRWAPHERTAQWQWVEPDRSFNGHVLVAPDGRRLFTTETDLACGGSVIVVRDARSLEKLAEWATGGTDAHDLLLDEGGGHLLVANGGVALRPETGRLKLQRDHMDSSIVKLDLASGRRVGQWRLADRRLSLRHLAWGPHDAQGRRLLGVALQAEHADAVQRATAPVLAVFDGKALQACEGGPPMAGYGGDIVGTASGFLVSGPRSGVLAHRHAEGRWDVFDHLAGGCALASDGVRRGVWAGGVDAVACLAPDGARRHLAPPDGPTFRLDNHWALLPHLRGAVPLDDHMENETS